jgi:hypothetical protein
LLLLLLLLLFSLTGLTRSLLLLPFSAVDSQPLTNKNEINGHIKGTR